MCFLKNEDGQAMVEYALIIGLIAIVVLTAILLSMGRSSRDKMNKLSDTLSTAGD